MVHILKEVGILYILVLTLEAKNSINLSILRYIACPKCISKEEIHHASRGVCLSGPVLHR